MMMTSDFSTSHTLVSLDYLRQVEAIDVASYDKSFFLVYKQ